MKQQKKAGARSRISNKYLTKEQAKAILDFLDRPELPEHDSPFKLYLNGKLIGSAEASLTNKTKKD